MTRSAKIAWAVGAGLLLLIMGAIAVGVLWFQRDRAQNRALEKAGTSLDEKKFDAAIALFDEALRLNLPPAKAAWAHAGRARAKTDKGNYDEAIRDFSEALRLNSKRVEAYSGRGYAYQLKGDFDNALRDYGEFLLVEQNAGWAYYNRGLIYLQRKEWAKAVADFSEAIRCEPRLSSAYYDRGSALAELGDLNGALASLDAAISINPNLAQAYRLRADVHRRRGELDGARMDELKASQLASKTLPSASVSPMFGPSPSGADLLNAARLAITTARYDQAIDLCNKALGTKLSASYLSGVFMTRGNAYASKGDWDHALRDYDEAIKAEPNNADAWVNRGNAYAHKNQRDKSTRDYNEAIRLNPKLPEAYCNRALDYLEAGDTQKALADLTEAIRLNPKFAQAFSRRAVVLSRLTRKDEALADAESALNLTPDSADAYLFRARIRSVRHEITEARADFEKALQLNRESKALVLNDVAWFFATCPDQSGRDGKKAVDLATKACQLGQWKDPRALDTLAAAFAEIGDFDQATKWQTAALGFPDISGEVRAGMQKRLALYQRHQPYRQELKL